MPLKRSLLQKLRLPLCAVGLFVALAAYMRWMESATPGPPIEAMTDAQNQNRPRPVAEVARAVQTMKLVTVQIETTVEVKARDESWRGDVTADIKVPARLYYGTDLSSARVEGLPMGPGKMRYVVRVPMPRRVATEVYGEMEEKTVTAGWARLKAVDGEYYLGLARKMVGEEARRMVLKPKDQEAVVEETRARVEALVRLFAEGSGVEAQVSVVFEDQL